MVHSRSLGCSPIGTHRPVADSNAAVVFRDIRAVPTCDANRSVEFNKHFGSPDVNKTDCRLVFQTRILVICKQITFGK